MRLNPFSRVARKRRAERKSLHKLAQVLDHYFVVRYAKNPHSELSALCQKHGADKGVIDAATHPKQALKQPLHNYADFYEMIFGGMRMQVKNVLECGIGMSRGASLRLWREYFPNAQITSIDINEEYLFTDERIETYYCDQTDSASIAKFLAQVNDRKFDIIIDDGLHTLDAAVTLFDGVIGNLADDGIYIVEDVRPETLDKFASLFTKNAAYHVQCINLHRPSRRHIGDNSLVVVTKTQEVA